MSNNPHMLLIDREPPSQDLVCYFSKFNITIVHQTTLSPLNEVPKAILIHHMVIRHEIDVLKHLSNCSAPLIVIDDRYDEKFCIAMLESGADDYITKPLYPRELHARINAITRRVTHANLKAVRNKDVLMFANWRVYPASRQVFNDKNQELLLSSGEYDLLYTFIQQPLRVLEREFLLQITKNSTLNPLDRRMDVQISRLRQKIECDAKKPTLIKTIRNGGYMFTSRVTTLKENDKE